MIDYTRLYKIKNLNLLVYSIHMTDCDAEQMNPLQFAKKKKDSCKIITEKSFNKLNRSTWFE